MTDPDHARSAAASGGEAATGAGFPWGVTWFLGVGLLVSSGLAVLLEEQDGAEAWQLGASGAAAVAAIVILDLSLQRLRPKPATRPDPAEVSP